MHQRRKRKTHFSDDEDDDLPLVALKKINNCTNDPDCYKSLCIPSSQPCEICDKVSKNRYSSLIHNMKHIIIPLIKQTIYECDVCLHHFTSTCDLINHRSKKHSIFVKTKLENMVNGSNMGTDEIYKSVAIKEEKCETESAIQVKEEESVRDDGILNGGCSMKNRLLFEEDIFEPNSDKLLDDLTKRCQVNVGLYLPVWDQFPQSIHYDQLVHPGVFKCRKCMRMFPNRYDMIVHESEHIVIKHSQVTFCDICNTYILGDNKKLKNHKLMSHMKMPQKNNYRDMDNGDGSVKIQNGVQENGGNFQNQNGDCKPYTLKVVTMKLCDVCLRFSKRSKVTRHLISYECVGELCNIGKTYVCDKCGNKFFSIKLVKRETKCNLLPSSKKKNKSNKTMSNKERLKVISKRFKTLKTS